MKILRDGFDANIYNEEIGNGDPVIVVSNDGDVIPLGTGFENMSQVLNQVAYCIERGAPSENIPVNRAEDLYGKDQISVFVGPSAELKQEYHTIEHDFSP